MTTQSATSMCLGFPSRDWVADPFLGRRVSPYFFTVSGCSWLCSGPVATWCSQPALGGAEGTRGCQGRSPESTVACDLSSWSIRLLSGSSPVVLGQGPEPPQ